MKKRTTPRSNIVAFRATPLVVAQLKEFAALDNQTISTWMNLRAQEAIKTFRARKTEAQPVQDGLL